MLLTSSTFILRPPRPKERRGSLEKRTRKKTKEWRERRERLKTVDLGRVYSIVNTGHIVVSVENKRVVSQRFLGAKAFRSSDKKELGQLSDFIGNVEKPYAVIKPVSRNILTVLSPGDSVYIVVRERPRRPRKHRRRSLGGS